MVVGPRPNGAEGILAEVLSVFVVVSNAGSASGRPGTLGGGRICSL